MSLPIGLGPVRTAMMVQMGMRIDDLAQARHVRPEILARLNLACMNQTRDGQGRRCLEKRATRVRRYGRPHENAPRLFVGMSCSRGRPCRDFHPRALSHEGDTFAWSINCVNTSTREGPHKLWLDAVFRLRFWPIARERTHASTRPVVRSVRSIGYGVLPVKNVSSAFDMSAAE